MNPKADIDEIDIHPKLAYWIAATTSNSLFSEVKRGDFNAHLGSGKADMDALVDLQQFKQRLVDLRYLFEHPSQEANLLWGHDCPPTTLIALARLPEIYEILDKHLSKEGKEALKAKGIPTSL